MGFGDWLSGAFHKLASSSAGLLNGIVSGGKNGIQAAAHTLKNGVQAISHGAGQAIHTAGNAISTVYHDAQQNIHDIISIPKTLGQDLEDTAKSVIPAISWPLGIGIAAVGVVGLVLLTRK